MPQTAKTQFVILATCLLVALGAFTVLGFVPHTLFRPLSFSPSAFAVLAVERNEKDAPTGQKTPAKVGRLSLRSEMVLPSECHQERCALLMSGFGKAAAIKIDGRLLAETGVFPRVIPRRDHFPIMASIHELDSDDSVHEIEIDSFCENSCEEVKAKATAQVVLRDDALSFVRASTVRFVFLPIACSMGLICISLITCVFLLSGRQQAFFGVVLVVHCIANGVAYFLFADILYESLRMRWAGPTYLSLRHIGNLAFFCLSIMSLRFSGWAKKVANTGFVIAALGTTAFLASSLSLALKTSQILDIVQPLDTIGRYFGPLKFAALITCLVACIMSWRDRSYWVPGLVFAGLVSITAFDETILFGYPYRSYVGKFHALVVGTVFLCVFLRRRTEITTEQRMQKKSEEDIGSLARQVAHDIRSPLAALRIVSGEPEGMADETRSIVEAAVMRLTGIADTLLTSHASGEKHANSSIFQKKPSPVFPVVPAVSALVAEKRVEYVQRLDIQLIFLVGPRADRSCVGGDMIEFQRVLSNLVNNAFEATSKAGTIKVNVNVEGQFLLLSVSDQGCGIPPHVLSRIGEVGMSYQKKGGTGLGLAHAKRFAESHGGELIVESHEHVGTTVTARVPLAATPSWFVEHLAVAEGQHVVIVDDDEAIHKMWSRRFAGLGFTGKVSLRHIKTVKDMREHQTVSEALYLVDYNLDGFGINGIDFIENEGMQAQAVLTTSASDEPAIQKRCGNLGIRLLAKRHAGRIEIRMS